MISQMTPVRPGNRIVVTSVTAANFSLYPPFSIAKALPLQQQNTLRAICVIRESVDSVCIAYSRCTPVCNHSTHTQCVHVRALKQVYGQSIRLQRYSCVSCANTRIQTKSPEARAFMIPLLARPRQHSDAQRIDNLL